MKLVRFLFMPNGHCYCHCHCSRFARIFSDFAEHFLHYPSLLLIIHRVIGVKVARLQSQIFYFLHCTSVYL